MRCIQIAAVKQAVGVQIGARARQFWHRPAKERRVHPRRLLLQSGVGVHLCTCNVDRDSQHDENRQGNGSEQTESEMDEGRYHLFLYCYRCYATNSAKIIIRAKCHIYTPTRVH